MQVTLMRAEPGEDHAPTKFSISEVQGDRSSCKLHCCSLCNVHACVPCTAHNTCSAFNSCRLSLLNLCLIACFTS